MVEIKVNASELKGDESKLFEKLSDFLKDKTSGDISSDGKTVTIKGEGAAITKKYIKVTVKKFLHKHELTETFRVIADEDNTLKIKERKLDEED
jgi:Ribosomal L22e protein family